MAKAGLQFSRKDQWKTGANLGKISMVARGNRATAGGYRWEYVDG